MINWKKVVNFSKKEWTKEPDKVSSALVFEVDKLTTYAKEQFVNSVCLIHVAYDNEGHVTGSQHYMGNAVDLHFAGVPLISQFLLALQFGFSGIGVYPYWKHPGLHLEIEDFMPERRKLWWRTEDGEYRTVHEAKFFTAIAGKVG